MRFDPGPAQLAAVLLAASTVLAASMVGAGAAPASSRAPTSATTGSAAAPGTQSQVPEVARRLWHDLLCLCGECEHETLEACTCEYAAERRREILDRVRTLGFGTPRQDEATYASVSREYLARHGSDPELARARAGLHMPAWLESSLTIAGAMLVAAALIAVVEIFRRRSRPKPRGAKPSSRPSSRPWHRERRRKR